MKKLENGVCLVPRELFNARASEKKENFFLYSSYFALPVDEFQWKRRDDDAAVRES